MVSRTTVGCSAVAETLPTTKARVASSGSPEPCVQLTRISGFIVYRLSTCSAVADQETGAGGFEGGADQLVAGEPAPGGYPVGRGRVVAEHGQHVPRGELPHRGGDARGQGGAAVAQGVEGGLGPGLGHPETGADQPDRDDATGGDGAVGVLLHDEV